MSTELVKRVEELVGHRNRALDQFKAANDMLKQADAAYLRAVQPRKTYGMPGDFYPRSSSIEVFRKHLDGDVWRNLLQMTQLGSLMDVKARKEFDDQCDRDPPEVTVDNVLATLANLMGSADDIFLRSVVTTFENLPRNYRSNDGFKYGKRIIMDRAINVWTQGNYRSWDFYHHCYAAERLQDLDRVFHVLDGKDPPERLTGAVQAVYEKCNARGLPFELETDYFRIKGFAVGTLHIYPLRRDLTEKANRMLAAHYGWQLGDGRTK